MDILVLPWQIVKKMHVIHHRQESLGQNKPSQEEYRNIIQIFHLGDYFPQHQWAFNFAEQFVCSKEVFCIQQASDKRTLKTNSAQQEMFQCFPFLTA